MLTKRFRRRCDHAATAEWQHRGNQTGFHLADRRVIQTLCEKRSCRGRNDECRQQGMSQGLFKSRAAPRNRTATKETVCSAVLAFLEAFHCLTTGNKLSVLMLEPLLNSTAAVPRYSQQCDHIFIKDFNVYDIMNSSIIALLNKPKYWVITLRYRYTTSSFRIYYDTGPKKIINYTFTMTLNNIFF